MKEAFEKIVERLDSHIEIAKSEGDFSYIKPFEIAKGEVQNVAEEYNNGWIPCSERLPEEPEEGLTDLDECDEYIAMIENADIPTALNYAGNGEWYRDGEFYKVIAWQPLPEPYKSK